MDGLCGDQLDDASRHAGLVLHRLRPDEHPGFSSQHTVREQAMGSMRRDSDHPRHMNKGRQMTIGAQRERGQMDRGLWPSREAADPIAGAGLAASTASGLRAV